MRSAHFGMLLGTVTGVVFMGSGSLATTQDVPAHVASCKIDDKIAASDRSSVDALSLSIARSMLEGDGGPPYRQMSEAARFTTSPSAFAQIMRLIALWVPYQDVHVVHTYQIDIPGGSPPTSRMICGRSLDDPDAMILSVAPVLRQFYVDVAAHTINNDWSISIGLFPEGGVLKAQSIRFDPTAISGRTSLDLRRLAREQVSRGHLVNAVLLYRSAEGMALRGPNAVPAWKHDLDVEVARLQLPQELGGGFEGSFLLADQAFSASNIGLLGLGGNLNLQLVRHVDR